MLSYSSFKYFHFYMTKYIISNAFYCCNTKLNTITTFEKLFFLQNYTLNFQFQFRCIWNMTLTSLYV